MEPRAVVAAEASGAVLCADVGLSFWGGVNLGTGDVIDKHHPLHGQNLAGHILALPKGRGSCTGSLVLLELLLRNCAPSAILLQELDEVITLAAVVAEEIFGVTLPVVVLGASRFGQLLTWSSNGSLSCILTPQSLELKLMKQNDCEADAWPLQAAPAGNDTLQLSAKDSELLDGAHGKAAQVAMKVVTKMAEIQGAPYLVDVTQVHIDACTYVGEAGLKVAQRLVEWGGVVRVPTTTNSISVERAMWRTLGVPERFAQPASDLADAYVALGAESTFTCAPYLLPSAPKQGAQVGWGESNAVVFANSVLGARTQKYADILDACVALTGRAPFSGCHTNAGRQPRLSLSLPKTLQSKELDDAAYGLLGYACGLRASREVPAILGLEHMAPTADQLKAFCAAFGTVSAAPMFHMAGVTPDPHMQIADCPASGGGVPSIEITFEDLQDAWQELDSGGEGGVDLIALGSPHFSVEEFGTLASLCRDRQKNPDVRVVVTAGAAVRSEANARGYEKVLTDFGVQIISDTCWCMLGEVVPAPSSVLSPDVRTLMTNSAKYAHYAPGLVGRQVRFGALQDCVNVAHSGWAPKQVPRWLQPGATNARNYCTMRPSRGMLALRRLARLF